MTTEAYRCPDGRIAVPVQHRRDMWLMIDHDGSTGVALGELSHDAQPLTVATVGADDGEPGAATEVARLFRAYRYNVYADPAHSDVADRMATYWPELWRALDRLQRDWQL